MNQKLIFLILLLFACISCKVRNCPTCETSGYTSAHQYNRPNVTLMDKNYKQTHKDKHGGIMVFLKDDSKDYFYRSDTIQNGDGAIPKFTITNSSAKRVKIISDTITLYFSQNYSNQLTPESYSKLYYLKEFLVKSKEVKIDIEAHYFPEEFGSLKKYGYYRMDSLQIDGSTKFSKYRAQCISNYLIENNIDAIRIKYLGIGCTEPLYDKPRTLKELNLNQRVYVIIWKKV